MIFHKAWLPQEQILAMPEVSVFLSHCGWSSITEAISTETSIICCPTFGDQIYNAELIHAKKVGIQVYDPKAIRSR